uniref:Ubiquitin carboxyl-terminal hydrolase n=1 Tax=Culex tarsalis TaxID=7177 RepID=A0A1Q3F6S7_CULTA
MAHKKPLHMGKNLSDLEENYKLAKAIGHKKVLQLCSAANRMKEHADLQYLERDEEQAYVFYMKYLNLISVIRNHGEYRDRKHEILESLGTNAQMRAIYEKLEKLKDSLEQRYSCLGVAREREQNKQRNQQDNMTMIVTQQKLSITAQELLEMIRDTKTSMLIIDCRPEKDLQASGIRYVHVVGVPVHLLVAGMTAGKIHEKLPPEDKPVWSSRKVKEQIVLMDYCTEGNPRKDTPLWVLNDILNNWDQDVAYKKPFLKVEGGYKNFQLCYPMCCRNPSYVPSTTEFNDDARLEDVEYPNISEIRMKDDSFGSQPANRPAIDRNSKVAALHVYENKSKPITELLEEQEKLMDKSIQNEREMLSTENVLKQIHDDPANVLDDNEKMEEISTLKYKLMQLEDKQQEYIAENTRLHEKVQEYKVLEQSWNESGDRISAREAELLEQEAQRRIKEKEDEQKRVEQERDRLARERLAQERLEQQREEMLRIAYENKRRLAQQPPEANVDAVRPKVPQFDRAAKPAVASAGGTMAAAADYNQNVYREVQRDFAPVYGSVGRGLTGLKNLGNTCYMNSILQCLSNTAFLREHFLEGAFRQNLNRSNKTQGRIVEEVAAVIKALWLGQYKCIASKNLRYVVGQYERQFGGIEQQDSHEFLTILMDWLHSDIQTVPIQPYSSLEDLPASERAWIDYLKGMESYISNLFYGQIKSTVKCVRCGKESATYESFSNLSLELPQNANRCHLNNCLEMYFNGENIRGWSCPQCKSNQEAIKKLAISRLPSILVIHFKRFYADPEAVATVYKKKQNYVKFPLQDLDMTTHIAPSELSRNKQLRARRYHLFGVSNHYGSMESGHYTAFCKNTVHQKWYKFDDHTVSSLDTSDVCSSAGYILFYSSLPETPETQQQIR